MFKRALNITRNNRMYTKKCQQNLINNKIIKNTVRSYSSKQNNPQNDQSYPLVFIMGVALGVYLMDNVARPCKR